jgi:nucleoside-diphosphate-sugar epimerase
MKIGIIGAHGFFGSVLHEVAQADPGFLTVPITRHTYQAAAAEGGFDVVVNSAMPSGRFWAHNNPDDDFRETVLKTHRIYHDFSSAKVVQISSVSARCQRHTVYGRHKRAAEAIVDDGKNLIVRLGPLYHATLSKGVILDIAHGRDVFVSASSRYGFTPVRWACEELLRSISQTGVIEIGARDAISLESLAIALNSPSVFRGELDNQIFDNAPTGAPPASAVVEFARNLVKDLGENNG